MCERRRIVWLFVLCVWLATAGSSLAGDGYGSYYRPWYASPYRTYGYLYRPWYASPYAYTYRPYDYQPRYYAPLGSWPLYYRHEEVYDWRWSPWDQGPLFDEPFEEVTIPAVPSYGGCYYW